MKVLFHPELLEEVVTSLLSISCGGDSADRYETEREEIYEQYPPEERGRGFEKLHLSLFRETGGTYRLIQEVFGEFPELQGKIQGVYFLSPEQSMSGFGGEEMRKSGSSMGADLRKDRLGGLPSLVIYLPAEYFMKEELLSPFLFHELYHVADMVHPDFQYREEEFSLLPAQEKLLRQRYGLLWSISIDARILRRGKVPLRREEEWKGEMSRAFPSHPPSQQGTIFSAVWDAGDISHPLLLRLASERPRRLQGEGEKAPFPPGSPCPLCGFPTFSWHDLASEPPGAGDSWSQSQSEAIFAAIGKDFPWWTPLQGACTRCMECYEVKAGISLGQV